MSRLCQATVILVSLLAGLLIGWVVPKSGRKVETETPDPWSLRAYQAEPKAFAVAPCTALSRTDNPLTPCISVFAGGKHLVFGAPGDQNWTAIGEVDAVFLMSGQPEAWNGLDGLRMESWRGGRRSKLRVIAGELQEDALAGLDLSQAGADALVGLSSHGQLDFLNSGVQLKPVPADSEDQLIYDTGDLRVRAFSEIDPAGDQLISYDVVYGNMRARISPCGVAPPNTEAEILVLPVMEQAVAVDRLRLARYYRDPAMTMRLEDIVRKCPTSLQSLDLAETLGVKRILFWRDDASREAGLTSRKIRIHDLADGMVELRGK